MRRWVAASSLVVLAACGGGSATDTTPSPTGGLTGVPTAEVHVTGATITPTGEDAAVITFGAHNAGGQTDQLVAVRCECGGTTTLLGADGDPSEGVDIAPEETLFLGPGSALVEVEGIPAPLEPGSFVSITASFAIAGEVVADAEVAPEP